MGMKKRTWTKDEVRLLKRTKRKGISLATLTKTLRRTAGAIYQKDYGLRQR